MDASIVVLSLNIPLKFKLSLTVSNDVLSFKILLKFKLLLTVLNICLFNDISSTLDVENVFSYMKSE